MVCEGTVRPLKQNAFGKEFPMENAIIIVVLVAILGGAIVYIVRAKKNGVKCIGCPSGGSCGANKEGISCSGCSGGDCGCGCGGESECHEKTK